MAKIEGMQGDVFFGSPDKPLPNWRDHIDENEVDDIEDEPVNDDPGEPTSIYGDSDFHAQGDMHEE